MTLGTDGFGRSDTRARLRRFFEVDAESTVIATLQALAQKGKIQPQAVAKAIKDLELDPEKIHPHIG
jgi:pyruvate dehydrogenase E1 component